MMKLYPHQKKQAKEVRKTLKKVDHVLFGLATGGGKSIVMLNFISRYLDAGKKVLVLAPFRKLIFQLEGTFSKHKPHVIMGTVDRGDKNSGLILSSIQTTNARLKKGADYYDDIDVIIIDEVHLGGNFPPKKNSQFDRIYNMYWESAKWLGFSATPITATGYRLEGWDKSVYKYQTINLIEMGFLAGFDYFAPEQIDLSSLRTNSLGEFVAEDVEEVTQKPTAVKAVKKQWRKHRYKKVIIFASSIEHAKLLTAEIPDSAIVHSNMKEKDIYDILYMYENNKTGTLINVGILTVGFDDPTVEVLILARPVKSIRLFIQICGRVLRRYENKRAIILDMCSCYENCGLPDDIRDFNRIKSEVKRDKTDDVDTTATIACRECKSVFKHNEAKVKKKTTKKYIKTRIYCPNCGELLNEKIEDLTKVDKLVKIGGSEVEKLKPLSYKKRREEIIRLIELFTAKRLAWSRYILEAIESTGRGELLDQAIRKGTTDKTLWKKIMVMYYDAKDEVEQNEKIT